MRLVYRVASALGFLLWRWGIDHYEESTDCAHLRLAEDVDCWLCQDDDPGPFEFEGGAIPPK